MSTWCRRAAVVAVLAATVAGCGINTDDVPRDVAPDQRALLAVDAADPSGSSGTSRIYLVTPSETGQQRRLRSVQRDVAARPEPLLGSLLVGPSQAELDARLATSIPPGTQLLGARTAGDVLFIDVSAELNELSGDALVLAVAQIVHTASEIVGVQSVRLRVDGVDQAWPKGDGQTTEGPLRTYDFPGLVQSAQPAYPSLPSRN
jgi:hypothetical protein